ncbi:NAD(P)/FAD-dependent oxidoreductase [Micromonospora sp. NPDC051296]|uniref:FAD-dependent oxidoreductase n=1 Tax=Micromonospora sp. NPDC051296 TaxID=3155046 RepID=UPI003424AEA7
MSGERQRVVIVGAGLAGSALAAMLGRRGVPVDVYERRADPAEIAARGGARSINLGISERGMRVLRDLGLAGTLAGRMVPMRGRAVHQSGGRLTFHPYGTHDHEILHSILRHDLNEALMDLARSHDSVRFVFHSRLSSLDLEAPKAAFVDERTGEPTVVAADVVIGADGVNSAVRREMQRGTQANFRKEFLEWGYREFAIPAPAHGEHARLEAFHVWPAANAMVVAQPNRDRSMTGTVFLPLTGEDSFATLTQPDRIVAFFDQYFPDLRSLVPDLVAQFAAKPVGHLVSVRTSPWSHADRTVLIGDACHAVYPFYGQGMNAALEDCVALDECLTEHPADLGTAFRAYEQRRRPHTDVLADLSIQQFAELRDGLRSPLFRARRQADLLLHRLFPAAWQPLYTLVSHTTTPYADALRQARRQDRLLTVAASAVAVTVAGALARGALRELGGRR